MDTQKIKIILQNLLQNFAEASEYKLKRRFPLSSKPKPDVNTNNFHFLVFDFADTKIDVFKLLTVGRV